MSNPYNYQLTKDGTGYLFVTSLGVEYIFYFKIPDEHFETDYPFRTKIFEFSFEPVGKKNNNDPRIKDTIIHVISEFFKKDETRCLLYICDSVDSKQYSRKRLFEKWLREEGRTEFEKINFSLELDEDMEMVGSIIMHSQNIHRESIQNFLDNKLREYGDMKR